MADNLTWQTPTATPPSGTVVATDDVGGVHYQRTKIDVGGDGLASPLVRGQQANASSLPVTLSTEQAALLGLLTTIDADTGAMVVDLAAIEVLLAAIETATEAAQAALEGTLTVGAVDVDTEAVSSFDHGSNRDIDTTAEQITTSSVTAKKGVLVRAAPSNTGTVYVGNSDVTADTTDATDGMPLQPGESLLVMVNNANLIYCIGSAANQKVFWMAV